MLAGSGFAHIRDVPAHDLEERFDPLENILLAADHDRQRCFPGADIAARHRCIKGRYRTRGRCLGDGPGQFRARGGHVDHDHPGSGPGQNPVLAKQNTLHIGRETDDGEDDVTVVRHFAWRRAPRCTFGDQVVGLAFRSVIDAELMTGVNQMAAHGIAHHAGADPAKFHLFHRILLLFSVALRLLSEEPRLRSTPGVGNNPAASAPFRQPSRCRPRAAPPCATVPAVDRPGRSIPHGY